jgi:hypothetical protein
MVWWDHRIFVIFVMACSFVGVNSFVTNVARISERIPLGSTTRFLCASLRMNADEPSTRVARRNYLFAAVSLVPSLLLLTPNEANAKEVINDCEPWYFISFCVLISSNEPVCPGHLEEDGFQARVARPRETKTSKELKRIHSIIVLCKVVALVARRQPEPVSPRRAQTTA